MFITSYYIFHCIGIALERSWDRVRRIQQLAELWELHHLVSVGIQPPDHGDDLLVSCELAIHPQELLNVSVI